MFYELNSYSQLKTKYQLFIKYNFTLHLLFKKIIKLTIS